MVFLKKMFTKLGAFGFLCNMTSWILCLIYFKRKKMEGLMMEQLLTFFFITSDNTRLNCRRSSTLKICHLIVNEQVRIGKLLSCKKKHYSIYFT